jgi:hypothetical protein
MLKENNKVLLIYGNSLASIISAFVLSSNKKKKIYLINNKKFWGGHFNSPIIKKKKFDAGMFLFEFDGLAKVNSLDPKFYDLKKFSNVQLYSFKIRKFINSFIKTKKIKPILFYYNKNFYNDYLISNDLKFLKKITQGKKIFNEVSKINIKKLKFQKIHANQKRRSAKYDKISLKTASIANHGLTFHRLFIEQFCKKVFNDSSKNIVAKFHRAGWLPLFWPETIRNVFIKKKSIKIINFEYSLKDVATSVINNILKKIYKTKNINIVYTNDQTNNNLILTKKTVKFRNYVVPIKNFIFGGDQNDFLYLKKIHLNDNFEKISIGILYLLTKKNNLNKNFSIINCVDKDICFYRVSNQSSIDKNSNEVKLSVEFNIDYLNSLNIKKIKTEKLLLNHLNKLSIFKSIKKVQFELRLYKNAIFKPTLKNKRNYDYNYNKMKNYLFKKNIIGPSAGFYKYSFNDQVVQGMKYENK